MLKNALSRLKSRVMPAARAPARVPDGTRVYAIGDIHGRADLLDQLHAKILNDAKTSDTPRKVVVYLGDYVDRGMDSKGVIDRLTADPLPGFEKVFLKGNHEDAFLKFFVEPEFGHFWKHYGGLETLISYGVAALPLKDEPDAFVSIHDELVKKLPKVHLDFLVGLQLFHVEGDYYFAHAGVRPGSLLKEQIGDDLLNIREEFLDSNEDFGKVVVHGHTPRQQPVLRHNRIGIDTGADVSGVLTCMIADGDSRFFLDTAL